MVTISTHNGSQVARQHNLRNSKVTDKEAHIIKNGDHEVWLDEAPRMAYKRIFGEAVENYNAKQQRADRQIKDYYNAVNKDTKKHVVYEMIVGVYGDVTVKDNKQILQQFYDTWQNRNSNLELIGAYFHNDEQGQPHLHLDYIPVATGYTKGMEKQNGLVKALEAQGFIKKGKDTAQIQWQRRENAYLETLCKEHGLKVEHPETNKKEHLETALYQASKELERTLDNIEELELFKQADSLNLQTLQDVLNLAKELEKQKEDLEWQQEQLWEEQEALQADRERYTREVIEASINKRKAKEYDKLMQQQKQANKRNITKNRDIEP